MSTISSFKDVENKNDVCRDTDCMKNFCESLREHVIKIINFKKKIMKLLAKKQLELNENANICFICKAKLKISILKINKSTKTYLINK